MTTIVGSGHVIGALQINLLTVKVSNSMSRFMKICFTVDGNNIQGQKDADQQFATNIVFSL